MKLSTLLSISQLSLGFEEKLSLASSNPSHSDLLHLGANTKRTERMLAFLAQGGAGSSFMEWTVIPNSSITLRIPRFVSCTPTTCPIRLNAC